MCNPILVIGQQGQVAQALKATLPSGVTARFFGRQQLDITHADQLESILTQHKVNTIINASGYTAVDLAESEPEKAFDLNATAVEHLATLCAKQNIRLIHLSSDYVFDGTQQASYGVDDHPNPLNVYGKSKLAGEHALTQLQPQNSTLIRSAWLYSPFGNNFVKTMLRVMRQQTTLSVIKDQVGSPTSAIELAHFIWRLTQVDLLAPCYHWSDLGAVSWYEFAQQIAESGQRNGLLNHPVTIKPILSREYSSQAVRPAFSALNSQASWSIAQPKPWQENLETVMQALKHAKSSDCG